MYLQDKVLVVSGVGPDLGRQIAVRGAAAGADVVLAARTVSRLEDVAAEIGLSPRQLRRRCHVVVGYGPKTLQRVLRFRRFVSQLEAGSSDLATLAAQTGYADQAHLTRECQALAGLTPAALARQRG